MCMIIQTKYFSISDPRKVIEIDQNQYKKSNHTHIVVREISFGKLYNPDLVHPLALWFHIEDEDVRECTNQEKKDLKKTQKYLHKKKAENDQIITTNDNNGNNALSYSQIVQTPKKEADMTITSSWTIMESTTSSKHLFFDDEHQCAELPFNIHFPKDEACHDLVSSIIIHRLHTLTSVANNDSSGKKSNTRPHVLSELELKQRFYSLKCHYSTFHWPVNEGREIVDETTLIPKVDIEYKIPSALNDTSENQYSHHSNNVWKSFIEACSDGFYRGVEDYKKLDQQGEETREEEHQLGVFKSIVSIGGDHSSNGDGTGHR